MTEIRFDAQRFEILASTEEGQPSRSIMGVAVPWNVTANASTGPVRFLEGSLPVDGPAPKLLRDHDPTQPIGLVTERVSTSDGMMFTGRISETGAGNEALVLATDGVLDAVSVGAVPTDFDWDGNVMVVKAAVWRELSVLPFGAFDTARIHQVAAEAAEEAADVDESPDPETDPETEPTEQEADAMTEATIPTSPIVVAASAPALTRPRITAAEAISGIICQKRDILEVLAADNLLSDVPGLLPEPIIGSVWDTQYAARPLIDAVGTRAMPSGGSLFARPYVTQTTAIGQQAAELDTLASAALKVDKWIFTKRTFGGYVNVSAQSGDWSEPALVQAIVNDMLKQYARQTDAYAATQMMSYSAAATDTIADFTDGDDVIAALYNGAGQMRSATGVLPTHLIVSTSVWAQLGQSKTAGGAYIFPYLNPSNAAGQMGGAAVMTGNPLGLSLVISDDMGAGDQAALLYGPALEVYEDRSRTGGIRVENPATASATLGLWGYIACELMSPMAGSYCLSLV